MARSKNLLLVGLLGTVVLGLGAAVWWLGDRPPPAPVEAAPIPPAPAAAKELETGPRVELTPSVPTEAPAATTVAWPVEVHLELVRADALIQADGAPALGSGGTASFAGSVNGYDGKGARVEVRFVAGPNAGRTLQSDALGRFGATALHPGLSIVEVRGAAIPGTQREVRLRPNREELLNLSWARPARIAGLVVDGNGKPLAGALVAIDGQERTSGDDGGFEFPSVAPGPVLVRVKKEGFASVRQTLHVAGGASLGPEQIKFRMDPGASLQVTIVDAINAGQQAFLYLLPQFADDERRFPWHEVNPVRIWPGGTVTIRDLPAGRVVVHLFHAGATGKPPRREIELQSGGRDIVEFQLEPAPVVTGRVTQDGQPVKGAFVRMEAPDRTQAMLSVFGESNFLYLERDVLPDLPPALQEVTTDAKGEFQLTSLEDLVPLRYVTARSADGRSIARAVLRKGDGFVELVLEEVGRGAGELVLQTAERTQGLPVAVTVNGEPREPFVLPPGRDLRVTELAEGTWKVSVRWSTEVIVPERELDIRGETRLGIDLPAGAVTGQDAATLQRVRPR